MVAGSMLLLGIWSIKKTGNNMDLIKEIESVQKCAQLLKDLETRWMGGGRLWCVRSIVERGNIIKSSPVML
jgi:hypothetical protein